MKVFVTGGAGYIGSVTVDSLLAAGHEVVVFDNLYMGHREAVNPNAVFIEGDLANAEIREIDALTDYAVSLAQYERARGHILEVYGVILGKDS